nr:pre-mRNA-splicing regulator WTAP [Tanacetum cinerariifolium]
NLDAENIAKEGFREAITLLESLKSNSEDTDLEQLSVLEEKDKKIKDLEANDQAVNFTSHSKM